MSEQPPLSTYEQIDRRITGIIAYNIHTPRGLARRIAYEVCDTYEARLRAVEQERDDLRARVAELEACADPEALTIAYQKGYHDAK